MNRIAIVDDNQDFLALMRMLLEEQGYVVETCSDGSRAFEFIKNWKPDLVYLDIRMTGASGWQILDQMKTKPETQNIKVIVTSAAAEELSAAEPELKRRGCDILLKPFDIDEVLKKTRRFIGPLSP
ncbi:MAG: response regulator [Chloroflexi bacterium]|nr:response regulator [Chloroflexota bacterium]